MHSPALIIGLVLAAFLAGLVLGRTATAEEVDPPPILAHHAIGRLALVKASTDVAFYTRQAARDVARAAR